MNPIAHRYGIGAMVRLAGGFSYRHAADGAYEVKRQLPSGSDGENRYRIKSAREDYERVASESDLEHA